MLCEGYGTTISTLKCKKYVGEWGSYELVGRREPVVYVEAKETALRSEAIVSHLRRVSQKIVSRVRDCETTAEQTLQSCVDVRCPPNCTFRRRTET
jgi:hypothetical protein